MEDNTQEDSTQKEPQPHRVLGLNPIMLTVIVSVVIILIIFLLILGISMCGRSPKDPEEAESKQAARDAYMSKLDIANVQIEDTFFFGKWVSGELRNTGPRTIRKIEITIFYLDKAGKAIFERTHYPVMGAQWETDENELLKPNHSQKFRYKLDDSPPGWSGEVGVKIAKIAFIYESW